MPRGRLLTALFLAAALFSCRRQPPLPLLGAWKIQKCAFSGLSRQGQAQARAALGHQVNFGPGSVDFSALEPGAQLTYRSFQQRACTPEEQRRLAGGFEVAGREAFHWVGLADASGLASEFYLSQDGQTLIFFVKKAAYLALRTAQP